VPMRAQVSTMANVDFGFLQAAAQRQLQDARAAREFQSRVDIKLDEIFGSMATAPEIRKPREEVAESVAQPERNGTADLGPRDSAWRQESAAPLRSPPAG
ncbi:MAG: hypothetical protein ABSG76_25790, partial [Xanthobacteraceae bacterium]